MRYYEISIIQQNQEIRPPLRLKPQFFSSTQDSKDRNLNTGLQIEFDLPIAPYSTPVGTQSITVYGVSLEDITQAKAYTGGLLTLKAGFQKGLPLANPAQAGVILIGRVFQAYGNWEGTSMFITFVVQASPYGFNSPGNIIFSCKSGQDLRDAIKATLDIAFPEYAINIQLPTPLIATRDLNSYYHTLEQFSSDMVQLSNDLSGNIYQVFITIQKGVVNVFQVPNNPKSDSTATLSSKPVQLSSLDFIGQPMWTLPNIIQCSLHMRADLMVGSLVKMPENMYSIPGYVRTNSSSLPSSLKYQSAFKGTFIVIRVRHTGNYRGTDPKAWVTIVDCGFYSG